MPAQKIKRTPNASKFYKNVSYETLTASWLTEDGWEVFLPLIDHDMKTDILVLNDENYYRIQVKTVESTDEDCKVENKWGDAQVDFVVYYSRSAEWGYIVKPFKTKKKRLNSEGHVRFHQHPRNFQKAFKKI